jgi:6-pyruvoyltetrahydropterin/6-carboxytetrahydropterin synthase
LHGHNGRAVITIEAAKLDGRGMVLDFSDIKRVVSNWIDENLDHRMILHRDDPLLPLLQEHDQPIYVIPHNPTAENIARLIFEYAQEQGFPVVEVMLWETRNSSAAYRQPLPGC